MPITVAPLLGMSCCEKPACLSCCWTRLSARMPSSFICVSTSDSWLLRLEVAKTDRPAARITSPIVREISSSISVNPRAGWRMRAQGLAVALIA
ncbi:hypothetical protein D9M68_826380 [compost metagenome]